MVPEVDGGAVQATTGASPNAALANAADEADEHTPETPKLADPPANVPAPTDAEHGKGELHELVSSLANQLEALTATVASLATKDSDTIKIPWTKRGGK